MAATTRLPWQRLMDDLLGCNKLQGDFPAQRGILLHFPEAGNTFKSRDHTSLPKDKSRNSIRSV